MTQTPVTLARIACATAALAFALIAPAAVHAQGPAQDAEEHASEAGQPDSGPDTLNTVQAARLQISAAVRDEARAEVFEQKAKAATSKSDQKKFGDKAKGAFDDAIGEYKAALKLDPRLVEAWVGMAGLMTRAARFDLAIQTYDKALAIAPDDVQALAGKGRAELAAFKVTEAKATYERIAATSAAAGHDFIHEMRAWLDATRPRLGPEMAQAIAQLDAWIAEREKR